MSEFKEHESCEKCGSSDGKAVYGDGSAYCFVCETYYHPVSSGTAYQPKQPKRTSALSYLVEDILELPIVAIPERGISKETAEYFGVRCRFSTQTGQITHHYYPYYNSDGVLVGYKEREVANKMFRVIGSLGTGLMGFNKLKQGGKLLIVSEGECFLPTAEVLTQEGWKSLQDLSESDTVCQVDNQLETSFVKPLAIVDKHYDGDMIEYHSDSYYSITTENHNLVRINTKGELVKMPAALTQNRHYKIPRTVVSTGYDYPISDNDLRLMVMFSADFTFREEGDIYGAFKKSRKVERATTLLNESGLTYATFPQANGTYTGFFVHRKQNTSVYFKKEFDHSLLSKLSHRQLKLIIDESVHWDGNTVPNRNQIEYSSKLYSNATFIQTAAHLVGYTSTLIFRKNEFGNWIKVSILFGKQTSSTQKGYKRIPYSGRVMCVTVPTGMILVRQNNSISVSGNCDTMSAHQMLKEQGKSYSVVSVATGANAKSIKDNLELLESYETVIINFDMDKAGNEGATKCLEVIQVGKGKRAKLPEGFKDNNELLMGSPTASKEFLSSIYNAKSFRPDGIVDMSEAWDVLFSDDNMLSIPYPWVGLNEKTYGCRYREIVTLTAATGGGKSQVVRELEHWLLNNTQDNIGILALEEGTGRTGWGLISVEANLPLSIREERKNVSKEMIKGWFDKTLGTGRVFSFDHFGSTTEENILARVRYMIKALDCKWIFLDHLSIVVSGMEDGGDERKTIDSIMTKLRMLVEETGAGLFLVSHLKRVSGNQGHENGVEVSISHLRGSQAIAQLSDMVIALERNQQADDPVEANTTTIRVLKNRYAGLTGVACKLVYDRDTGRLSEKEEDEDAQDF